MTDEPAAVGETDAGADEETITLTLQEWERVGRRLANLESIVLHLAKKAGEWDEGNPVVPVAQRVDDLEECMETLLAAIQEIGENE